MPIDSNAARTQIAMPNAVNIEPFLLRHLERLLRSCGFEFQSSAECSNFLNSLRKFMAYIARTYNAEIEEQLRHPHNEKSKDELISWTISEIQALQAVTYQRFEKFITRSEMISSGIGKIDCKTAHGYSFKLSEIYQSAVVEWKSHRDVEPMSQKHKDKRRKRVWAPYLVDLLFER